MTTTLIPATTSAVTTKAEAPTANAGEVLVFRAIGLAGAEVALLWFYDGAAWQNWTQDGVTVACTADDNTRVIEWPQGQRFAVTKASTAASVAVTCDVVKR